MAQDCEVRLGNPPETFRLVTYRDAETNIVYPLVTNTLDLPARTSADLYKERWQIELFFKWIKQNLKVKSILGTSMNAVKAQFWIILCAYLPSAVVSKVPVENQRVVTTYIIDIAAKHVRARRFYKLLDPPKQENATQNGQLFLL